MKKLILILGANGIGKTSVGKEILTRIKHIAFIDAEWCRAINPFDFTNETKKTVENNIFCMIRNYLLCPDINYVIFPYGFHKERKEIFDNIINKLNGEKIQFKLCPVILTCDINKNIQRMKSDNRNEERIRRAIENTRDIYSTSKYG